MQIITFFKKEEKVAKTSIIVILLALIRCLAEIFRLQSISTTALTVENVKPFILGSLLTAVSVLLMIVLFFYKKYKFIIVTAIVTIILLITLKYNYAI